MADLLLIDDDALVRQTLRRGLEAAGHRVRDAANGREGLKLLADRTAQVVVTDILMPDKEGIETIIDIRRHAPEVIVIAMSGGGRLGKTEVLDIAQKFGANVCLSKPVTPHLLNTVIDEQLAARQR